MPYDHSRKIGNQGDVVKHSVLHNCVSHLLSCSPKEKVFRYAESHCGRPIYVLPDGKGSEWTRGIGLISSKTNEARTACARIDDYFRSNLSSHMKVGQQYFGSSNIVFRCLRAASRDFCFDLFETDVHAYDDLTRFYTPWLQSVHLNNTDGYNGVENLDSASLILIDPPSLETEKIANCIAILKEKKIPYICWTPRNSSSNGNRMESQLHRNFGERDDLGHQIEVSWTAPTGAAQNTFGCRLTVSNDLNIVAAETVQQLTNLLAGDGWNMI